MAGYANWQSDEVESLVPVGSTPTSVTDNLVPWSNGEDTCVTCRRVMVRFHPGSLRCENIWSVGAEAAHRFGMAEDWVQFPDGPLIENMGGSSNGKMPRLHRGDRGSIPRPVHCTEWAHGPTGRHRPGVAEDQLASMPVGAPVRFSVGPLNTEGSRIRLAGPVC